MDTKCAGINRHGIENERVLQRKVERTTLAPSHAAAVARPQSKR